MKQPTPDEIQAALRLASWLEGEEKQQLDSDVLEAIYVISPERCPEPSVALDEILSGVTQGPFGQQNEEKGLDSVDLQQDEEYLRNLLSHPAPTPQTSLGDILSRVESGPFAKQEEVKQDPSEALPDNIVVFRPWWKRSEVALVAAAAVALFILIPANFQMSKQAEQLETMDKEIRKTSEKDYAPEELNEAKSIEPPLPNPTIKRKSTKSARAKSKPPKPASQIASPQAKAPALQKESQVAAAKSEVIRPGDGRVLL